MRNVKTYLDEISSSFCLAKWYQLSLHLQLGHTHSCHNPRSHLIPLSELRESPDALHNTALKKAARLDLLAGIKTPECTFCWNMERTEPVASSDRFIKSGDLFSLGLSPSKKELADPHPIPRILEVSFSNTCNLKCTYCSPSFSSSWMEELKQYGFLDSADGTSLKGSVENSLQSILPIREDNNPYIESFWKWWPNLKKHLKVLRLTGGEPFLSPHTLLIIEKLIQDPEPELSLSINSNLSLPARLFEKHLDALERGLNSGAFKELSFFVSLDSVGDAAEYIRSGLNLSLLEKNLNSIFKRFPLVKVTIMATFTIFSYERLLEFLDYTLTLKRSSLDTSGNPRLVLDFAPLTLPRRLSYLLLGNDGQKNLEKAVNKMRTHSRSKLGFTEYEIIKLERLSQSYSQAYQNIISQDCLKTQRTWLLKYVEELDRRRNTNFAAVFPSLNARILNLLKE